MSPLLATCTLALGLAGWPAARQGTVVTVEARAPQHPEPQLDVLLARVADYVETYEAKFSGVVSEEDYEQYSRFGPRLSDRRALRSDVILVNGGPAGWMSFRDVFEVDRTPVRDRDDRLFQLFLNPLPNALDQAARIVQEGARYNVGPLSRNINVPTMALAFWRGAAQARSAYTVAGADTADGRPIIILGFREMASPRIIHTADGVPAAGRAWVDAATGRIVRTELDIDSMDVAARITVTYAPQEKLDGLWVPVQMQERYTVNATRSIFGTAHYSNFRRFNVDVATIIKK